LGMPLCCMAVGPPIRVGIRSIIRRGSLIVAGVSTAAKLQTADFIQ
jgi:hypothetical protein